MLLGFLKLYLQRTVFRLDVQLDCSVDFVFTPSQRFLKWAGAVTHFLEQWPQRTTSAVDQNILHHIRAAQMCTNTTRFYVTLSPQVVICKVVVL